MENINFELLKVRLISFGATVGSIVLVAVVGALADPQIEAAIAELGGGGIIGTVLVLVFKEFLQHLRNLKVVREANELGAEGQRKPIVLI